MSDEYRQGLVSRRGLTADDYERVTQLATLCDQSDNITLKINYDTLRTRPGNEINDFLYYEREELIGFLGLYQFNSHEIEISGMVHPAHRRKGIFSALLSAAKQEVRQRGISKLIFINETNSASGKSFLESLGAKCAFSEYSMKMTQIKLPQMKHPIQLRPAMSEDIGVVAHMEAVCFDGNEAELLETMTKQWSGKKDHSVMLIELSGDVVGTVAMNHADENSAFIHGFCVLPEHQGRGYGRQALALAIRTALGLQRANIELEVACANSRALSLYQSCGFEVMGANDYYVQMLDDWPASNP
ncbi:MAG: GNAT family N-acetyltransferase [Bacilli bacterium]